VEKIYHSVTGMAYLGMKSEGGGWVGRWVGGGVWVDGCGWMGVQACVCVSVYALASFPGCLPLRSLDCICKLWASQGSGRRPGMSSTSSNRKVDSIMTYVDSVSVIMATCPQCYCTFLRVLLGSPQTNGSGFLTSYCWLLRYRGGPLEVSGTDPLAVLLL